MTLRVSRLEPTQLDELATAAERCRHLPFTRVRGLPRDGGLRWVTALFAGASSDGGADQAFVARSGEEITGGLVLRPAGWESGIYDLEMARIPFLFTTETDVDAAYRCATELLEAADRTLSERDVRHCSALVMAEDIGVTHAFENRGWRLMDSMLDIIWECGRTSAAGADPAVRLREVIESDREVLGELARRSFSGSTRTRFNADPRLPIERTGELYAQWFQLACDGEFGDMVVVAECEGRPVGFTTSKLDEALSEATGESFLTLGICGVFPEHRGGNLFPAMAHWLAEWHRKRGGRFVYSRINIDNYAIQSACLRSGAFITKANHSFHHSMSLSSRTAKEATT